MRQRQFHLRQSGSLVDQQFAVSQRVPNDTRCVEGVKSFFDMLQYQNSGAIHDRWYGTAEAGFLRPETNVTAFAILGFCGSMIIAMPDVGSGKTHCVTMMRTKVRCSMSAFAAHRLAKFKSAQISRSVFEFGVSEKQENTDRCAADSCTVKNGVV